MNTKKLSLIILLFTFKELNSIIILVHGTFASKANWHKPGGDFFKQLKKEAEKINQKVFSFQWSGRLSHMERIKAASKLAKIILHYPKGEIITLIGHSHGGNVIILASKLISKLEALPEFKNLSNTLAFSRKYRKLKEFRKKSLINNNSQHPIKVVHLLATPIHEKAYFPDMNTIKYLCNYYSLSDKLQTIFGRYSQKLNLFGRAVNFEVEIKNISPNNQPSHTEMHHPTIAKHIINIPFGLKKNKIGGFDKFDFHHNGKIIFDYNNIEYIPISSKKNLSPDSLNSFEWR